MSEATHKSVSKRRWSHLAIIPLVLLGIVLVAVAALNRTPPRKINVEERSLPVRTATVQRLDVVPKATGYGTTKPHRVWSAIAQVTGEIVYLAEDVRVGSAVPEGMLIARIDPDDYTIALRQAEARLEIIDAQVDGIKTDRENAEALLRIERRVEQLAVAESERHQALRDGGAVSASEEERSATSLLRVQRIVQELTNQLRALEVRERELRAQRSLESERLAAARLDLERTEIRAPFDGVVSALDVEAEQYVRQGSLVLALDETAVTEVVTQFRAADFARLLPVRNGGFAVAPDLLQVRVSAISNTHRETNSWPALFDRYSDTFDPRTGTLGAVVRIDNPQHDESIRIPKGVFCRVELYGQPLSGRLVIPRSSINEGQVIVVDAESRLSIRPVEIDFLQDSFAVVREGLSEGEHIVVSELSPAIVGMKLTPEPDRAINEKVAEEAHVGLHASVETHE